MLELDGRAGGGQLLRTALALAVADGRPFRMENVRGDRPNPGLRPQHLACVRAAATVCDGDVDGAELGAETLAFRPGDARLGGDVSVAVDTAGSVTLVFETLLPLADALDSTLTVTATGGTDVKWAPPIDYHRRVKCPFLARFGYEAAVTLYRRGFYPAGDGRASLRVRPSSPSPVEVTERGDADSLAVYSVASESLEDAAVADRQAEAALDALDSTGASTDAHVTYAPANSPGSAVVLRAAFDRTLAGFSALGEKGVPAETVAERAVSALHEWRDGPGAVDEHLGDQLLVLLARTGGRVRLPRLTAHVETNLDVIRAFGYEMDVEDGSRGVLVSAPQ